MTHGKTKDDGWTFEHQFSLGVQPRILTLPHRLRKEHKPQAPKNASLNSRRMFRAGETQKHD